jgi:hypothetical protein
MAKATTPWPGSIHSSLHHESLMIIGTGTGHQPVLVVEMRVSTVMMMIDWLNFIRLQLLDPIGPIVLLACFHHDLMDSKLVIKPAVDHFSFSDKFMRP